MVAFICDTCVHVTNINPISAAAGGNGFNESPNKKHEIEGQNNDLKDAKIVCRVERNCSQVMILSAFVTMRNHLHIIN